MTDDGHRLAFVSGRLGPGYERRVTAVPAGSSRPYQEAEWRDALVVVAQGEIELECEGGGRRCFRTGAVLWLRGLHLCALHNRGREPAVLVAVSRRTASGGERPP